MEVFEAIGLAVAGIFTTIVLAGMLAGVIAFGLMDLGIRERIHRRVVRQDIDHYVSREDLEEDTFILESLRIADPTEMDEIFALASKGEAVPTLLGMTPHQIFGLNARQLCGQIAARINREMMGQEERSPPSQSVTALFALAQSRRPSKTPSFMKRRVLKPAEQALEAVDKLQIDLGNAVRRTVVWMTMVVTALVYAALYIPTASKMAFFVESSDAVYRAAGGILAALVAIPLLFGFAFGSIVVATLTFSWVDRLASSR